MEGWTREEREETDFFEKGENGGSGVAGRKEPVVTTPSNFYCRNVAEKESIPGNKGGCGWTEEALGSLRRANFSAALDCFSAALTRRRTPNKASLQTGRMPSDKYKTIRNTG